MAIFCCVLTQKLIKYFGLTIFRSVRLEVNYLIRIKYNSPVVLTFAFISLFVLLLDRITSGASTMKLFCVYRSSFRDPLTYPRFFLHVLGHNGMSHYMNNILLMLVIGPPLEEKFGSRALLAAMTITAFISGIVQFAFFPGSALLGASGIVFMMIVMLSMTGKSTGTIPLTMILVLVLYVGQEVVTGLSSRDNISQLTHVIGGICGAVIGSVLYSGRFKHRRR